MPNLVLNSLKDLMKQMKKCEMSFKQPQNEVRLNPKPTPRSKRDKLRCSTGREDPCKNNAAWVT